MSHQRIRDKALTIGYLQLNALLNELCELNSFYEKASIYFPKFIFPPKMGVSESMWEETEDADEICFLVCIKYGGKEVFR